MEDEIADGNAVENAADMEIDEETEALQPLSMHFPPSEYVKKIKLSTRCYIHEVLTMFDKLAPPMSKSERAWFEDHLSFQHVFHMPRDPNHRLMGMWMLLLRTARIERKKEVWFIVNGVPIRYGISEHALISGFNCKNYTLGYEKMGSMEFKTKHFKNTVVKREDVGEKLLKMKPAGERSKERNFPWGRYSFDYMLGTIVHTMDHFNGFVTNNEKYIWPVPGFCLPLELPAFEAIPL
ncbi:uncharacterized protein At3g43530-like isoform X2 [Arabidopsis lyrata subsp. lyrata]|uniref:uncharacterized protein At3g43530-like isoform X2 n=1 Tax=Arabidopsis lyrata subsp. lyrata TaxID=81972 RepID=UPI000A29E0FC|nr:uncharacterized protein At3g43530-like isoform X2 [Arabidopsis lyrata subsp. lyrata]|eukprot:XP_020877055.1 uncharacterized protein At3g43530-like isoform X2 [Arabidopsis lyrata subsp. lyrata]